MDMLTVALLLVAAHALCDFPLQGDFLAKAKAGDTAMHSGLALFMHSAIHAAAVRIVTGSIALAGAELVAHWAIDEAKVRGRISFNADQGMHLFCKACYVAALWLQAR